MASGIKPQDFASSSEVKEAGAGMKRYVLTLMVGKVQ